MLYDPILKCFQGDDNDDDTGGNFDFNFTDDGSVFSQSQDSECSQPMPFDQTQLDGTLLTGDRLIAQPHKVSIRILFKRIIVIVLLYKIVQK